MLKKLLAMAAASVMMLSCFGGAVQAATSGTLVDEFTDLTKFSSTEYGVQFNNAAWSLNDNYGLTANNTKQLVTVIYEVDGVIDSISTEAIYTSVVSSATEEKYVEDLVFYLSKDGEEWEPISVTTATESKSTTYSNRKMQKRTFTSEEISDTYSFLKVTFPASAVEGDIDGDGTVGWNNRWYIVIDNVTINYTIPDYTWGELVSKKEASSDTTDWVTKWDTDTADSKKRAYMNNIDNTAEAASSMWRLFNGDTASTYIRMSDAYTYGFALIDGHNDIFRVTSHNSVSNVETNVAGYTFYSTTDKLIPRMGIIDAASGNNANPSSKKEAMTLTYEFDFKTLYNFINTEFTIGTGFSSSDTNKAICALYVNDEGLVYSTFSNFNGSNGVEIAQLELGTTYKMGIVIKLTPTETANTYTYEISVYIDGVKKFNGLGSDEVTSVKPGYYGMEIEPHPWTVSEFDYANSVLKDCTDSYTSKNTTWADTDDVKLSSSVKYEYTIIDTDTIISSYNVYAYDKYAQDAASLSDSTKEFHISSNVRNNTNYVTVAADAGTATAARALLATYDSTGKLVNVKTENMTLSADAITETDIELTNEGASKKMVFILDGMSNLKPLAAATQID